MEIILYKNSSDNKVVNKKITQVATKTGTLKDICNVIAPNIRMEYVDVTSFNYAYIPKFKRYYYVNSYTIDSANTMSISLGVDVKMSFKDAIKTSSAIVVKSTSKYQMRLNDGGLHCTQDTIITHINFEKAFNNLDKSFVLVVAGSQVQ